MALAKEHGWKILLPGLVSKSQSQTTNEGAAPSQSEPHPKFDEQLFNQDLLNFVVADDQVCSHIFFLCLQCSHLCVPTLKSLNLVEGVEFRRLLSRQSYVGETVIPHRNKLRLLVLQAWKKYFQFLRCDLAVCDSNLFYVPLLFS